MKLRETNGADSATASGADRNAGKKARLEGLEPGTPAVPCFQLTGIAAPLMKHLTAVLQTMQQREEELTRVKRELERYKVQMGDWDLPDDDPSTPTTRPAHLSHAHSSSDLDRHMY